MVDGLEFVEAEELLVLRIDAVADLEVGALLAGLGVDVVVRLDLLADIGQRGVDPAAVEARFGRQLDALEEVFV